MTELKSKGYDSRILSQLRYFDGTGNTFYFLKISSLNEFPTTSCEGLRKLAIDACHQKKSADGFVVYKKNIDSVEMLIVNSDGSFAGTCGNALRCLGLALLQDGVWNGTSPLPIERMTLPFLKPENIISDELFIFETGKYFATLASGISTNRLTANVSVNMGAIKTFCEVEIAANEKQNNHILQSFFVELANPHWVFLLKGAPWSIEECKRFGSLAQTTLRTLHNLPVANIGMLWPNQNAEFGARLVVYERGVGLTQCCGSGACAAAAVQASRYPQQQEFSFEMPGGVVKVRAGNEFVLSGSVLEE